MEGTDSGGGRRIGLRLGRGDGWMDGWHGGDFTFIPEMHVCDGRGIDRDMHREEGREKERREETEAVFLNSVICHTFSASLEDDDTFSPSRLSSSCAARLASAREGCRRGRLSHSLDRT